jgi:orotidine-5'-phosphate decarboxylase
VCVGLDPAPGIVGPELEAFLRQTVDATAEYACCFKPQFAHFAARAAEPELERIIRYIQDRNIPVILDAKRGDVGSTAVMYAREVFERYGADAVTLNPYLGHDSLQPYLDYEDRGCIVLCRTSNPGGSELQNLTFAGGETLFERVARLAATAWNTHANVLLVVGATAPTELARIREIVGSMTLLLPGLGTQGGDVAAAVAAGAGGGLIMSASRSILYAGSGQDAFLAAATAARQLRDEINDQRLVLAASG